MNPIRQKDLNAYCAGHLQNRWDDPGIAAYPEGFFTEALALGAACSQTPQGFITPQYGYTHPAQLSDLPQIAETTPVRDVLTAIQKKDPEKTALLKVNGPYSVLASLVEPKLFYRWLGKEQAAVRQGLETISAGIRAYIQEAFALGVQILSLADPYANVGLLGEKHYRVFAGAPLIRLVQGVLQDNRQTGVGRIIHLCPHNSLPLEQFGLLQSETVLATASPASYTLLLIDGAAKGIPLVGHRCIYSRAATELIGLAFV
ncbi:MAG: uroporphyrinogen decarboxylase family protein [Treponema sp.]|jgi:uroporphyrinogen-III decarboxylase|nr:uroporphyrinogen decarboxylase family protein [Treponema sp.]